MDVVNLASALSRFTTHWDPKIVGELNGQHVKLVKFSGPFVWHSHENEDELFLVVKGSFTMEFRDRAVEVNEGEFIIVPAAPSTGRMRRRKFTSCCSNRRRR